MAFQRQTPRSDPGPVVVPAKIAASSKVRKALDPKPQVGSSNSKAVEVRGDTVNTQLLRSGSPLTIQLAKSQPSSVSMKPNTNVCNSEAQPGRKVSVKPTSKLMQAVQNLGPDSKRLHVKLVRRESEDTSSYESDSSGNTLSGEYLLGPNAKAKVGTCPGSSDSAVNKVKNFDLSSFLQNANIDLSKIPKQEVEESLDFSGIPFWFPLKIKRILKDDGFPDALPFKSVHKLTRYRAWLEARRRQRWRRYLKAGKCRWQLSNTMKKLRQQPSSTTTAFYDRRLRQQSIWKERACRAMKKLDIVMGGIKYLDEQMAGIFETERDVYKKYLD